MESGEGVEQNRHSSRNHSYHASSMSGGIGWFETRIRASRVNPALRGGHRQGRRGRDEGLWDDGNNRYTMVDSDIAG